jgi:tRNA modification GTPase
MPLIPVSALSGEGVGDLARAIRRAVLAGDRGENPSALAPNARQKRILDEACSQAHRAVDNLRDESPLEIVALDLQHVLSALDEITGTRASGDVLDRVFSRFCLGK